MKPQYFTDSKMYDLDDSVNLFFIALWCIADDGGGLPLDLRDIELQAPRFMGRAEALMARLISVGLVVRKDTHYHIKNFTKHQYIEKPSKYRYGRESGRSRGVVGDHSGQGCSSPHTELINTNTEVFCFFPIVGSKDATEWPLEKRKIAEYAQCFPTLNVEGEVMKARQWTIDNPDRRKTARGMFKFLFQWLSRAQNSRTPGGYREQTRVRAEVGAAAPVPGKYDRIGRKGYPG